MTQSTTQATAQALVVDDDRGIRDLLQCALEIEGYEVLALSDGRKVIETLERLTEPCIVLLDLMMPHMDGWAVCRDLEGRPDLARHTVIIMTAGLLPGDIYPPRAHSLLRKPFDLNKALDLIASLAVPGAVAAQLAPEAVSLATLR